MILARASKNFAFTLIELLTVIAIIAIVAGLLVGLNNVVGDKARISRALAERDRLVTLIEAYKLKLGVYPPANTNDPANNTLVHELAGAFRDTKTRGSDGNPAYTNALFWQLIASNELRAAFGVSGLVNASDDQTEIKRFLKNLKPNQYVTNGSGSIWRLVIDIDGTNSSNPRPNYWNYLAGTDDATKRRMKNPETFDLWVDIKTRGQTRTIGNWKD